MINMNEMRQKFRKNYFFFFLLTTGLFLLNKMVAQTINSHGMGRTIEFPDIPGYTTMVCDFHQHTVFSDGEVWPSIRVKEAIKDGLNAIAITDLPLAPARADVHVRAIKNVNRIPRCRASRLVWQII